MKNVYNVKPYQHPTLKWVVRGKESEKWVRRFFKTKIEAQTYAQLKNIEVSNLGLEGAAFPIELRAMAQEAARELAVYGKTIRDAKNFYLKHLLLEKRQLRLSSVITDVVRIKTLQGIKPRTMKNYRMCVMKFGTHFEERNIDTISTEEIQIWLSENYPKPVSRNNNRRMLLNLFNIAIKRKLAIANPVLAISPAIERQKEVEILLPSQVARLLECSDFEILPYFAIAAFAGIRPEELKKPPELRPDNAELLWSDVKWEQAFIRVRPEVSKVGKARNVIIEPNLIEWLKPYRAKSGPVCTPSWLRLFRKTRRDAAKNTWPPDCLRHSFASYWLEKYKDAPRLALEMGNSVEVIMSRYHRVLDDPADSERFWNIFPT